MGIRYLAFPVPADVAESFATAPADYFRSRLLFAGDGRNDDDLDELDMPSLDLDKAWGYLQRVLNQPDGEPPRPAYELVRGEVEMTGSGWKSYVRLLTVQEVAAAAADLALVDECEVMERLRRPDSEREPDRYERDVGYTLGHLARATEYLAEVAGAGYGLAYVIG